MKIFGYSKKFQFDEGTILKSEPLTLVLLSQRGKTDSEWRLQVTEETHPVNQSMAFLALSHMRHYHQ